MASAVGNPDDSAHVVPSSVTVSVGTDDQLLTGRLHDEIYASNVLATGMADGLDLTIRATDTEGRLVAGLTGWTWGGCGYVDVLWVRADLRGCGMGTRLMDAAEEEARLRGCSVMALSTHSFQAPAFYDRRGYVETGRTVDYPVGHTQLHLSKELTGIPPQPPTTPDA